MPDDRDTRRGLVAVINVSCQPVDIHVQSDGPVVTTDDLRLGSENTKMTVQFFQVTDSYYEKWNPRNLLSISVLLCQWVRKLHMLGNTLEVLFEKNFELSN